MVGKGLLNFLGGTLGVAIIIGFFLPWISLSTDNVLPIPLKINQKLLQNAQFSFEISGFDIVNTAAKSQVKPIISFAKMFVKNAEKLDQKVYLLYLIPIFGFIVTFFSFKGVENLVYHFLALLISGGIFGWGMYQILTQKSTLQFEIGIGLWMILFSMFLIFLVSFVNMVKK